MIPENHYSFFMTENLRFILGKKVIGIVLIFGPWHKSEMVKILQKRVTYCEQTLTSRYLSVSHPIWLLKLACAWSPAMSSLWLLRTDALLELFSRQAVKLI